MTTKTFDFESRLAEVQQQTDRFAGGSKIIQTLGSKRVMVLAGSLEFEDHEALDEDVHIEVPDQKSIVENLDWLLRISTDSILTQLVKQRILVDFFQKATPKCVRHFERAADDAFRQPIQCLFCFFFVFICVHLCSS